jgi:hypothetical protein
MAERRMFSKTIIDSDVFLDMPVTAQLLYFHLSMRADDDGFINKPKSIMRMCSAKEDDMNVLIAKQFVIPFESGIVVIKHWKIHNYIRKDTYTRSRYTAESAMLTIDENKTYCLLDSSTDCQQLVNDPSTDCQRPVNSPSTQDRLGKDRIGKDKEILLSVSTDANSYFDYETIMNLFHSVCVSLPKIRTLTDLRKQKIRNAGKQLNGDFESFFQKVESSDFLTGRSGNWNGCSFDWIFKPQNLIKIIEGNYDNKKAAPSSGYYIDYSEGTE